MGVNITTIAYIRVLIIEIGSTIILMVVEAQGMYTHTVFFAIGVLFPLLQAAVSLVSFDAQGLACSTMPW